jgi:hypothetical protein
VEGPNDVSHVLVQTKQEPASKLKAETEPGLPSMQPVRLTPPPVIQQVLASEPEPVISIPVSNRLQDLIEIDPYKWLGQVVAAIIKLYQLQKRLGKFSREKSVPTLMSQVQWDYLIGPAEPGSKQPGLFRNLELLIQESQGVRFQEENMNVTTNIVTLWYITNYGHLPAVDAEVYAFAPTIWQSYHEQPSEPSSEEEEEDISLNDEDDEEE